MVLCMKKVDKGTLSTEEKYKKAKKKPMNSEN